MYIRFVTAALDTQSGRRQGLFYAAYALEERSDITSVDLEELTAIHGWFAKHMNEPTRMSLSPRPNRQAQALSWFKESSVHHVSKMRQMQVLLEKYGVFAETLRTKRPGYVVYEDQHQIVAYPFADTPT